MKLSLLQLNINGDNFWERLIPFLTTHNFDVLHLQEVTGKGTISGNINTKRDVFLELQNVLKERYHGELAIAERFTSSPSAYMGNATFYKKNFSLIEKYFIPIYQRTSPFPSSATTFEDEGRVLLHIKLSLQGKTISFLNTHFAWAKRPFEESHQTKQGEIFLEYFKSIQPPFIFSADTNLNPEQPLIQKLNLLGQNLASQSNVTNTLNPRTYRAKQLFPPGIPVDYIFISNDLKAKKFKVLEEDLSDHFGLTAEIEI